MKLLLAHSRVVCSRLADPMLALDVVISRGCNVLGATAVPKLKTGPLHHFHVDAIVAT